MISTKRQANKEVTVDQIKDVIRSANLADLRILEISLKERKQEIVNNGEESFKPAESLAVNTIRGTDYLYLHKRVNGKMVSRIVNENDLSNFDFEMVKISPKARKLLQEKYRIEP